MCSVQLISARIYKMFIALKPSYSSDFQTRLPNFRLGNKNGMNYCFLSEGTLQQGSGRILGVRPDSVTLWRRLPLAGWKPGISPGGNTRGLLSFIKHYSEIIGAQGKYILTPSPENHV